MSNGFWDSTAGELIGVASIIFALTIGVGGCKFLEGIADSRISQQSQQTGFSLEEISTAFILGLKAGWDSANDGKCSTENCVRVLKKISWKTRCRCSVCERLRANGEPGMDGISNPEEEGRGQQ